MPKHLCSHGGRRHAMSPSTMRLSTRGKVASRAVAAAIVLLSLASPAAAGQIVLWQAQLDAAADSFGNGVHVEMDQAADSGIEAGTFSESIDAEHSSGGGSGARSAGSVGIQNSVLLTSSTGFDLNSAASLIAVAERGNSQTPTATASSEYLLEFVVGPAAGHYELSGLVSGVGDNEFLIRLSDSSDHALFEFSQSGSFLEVPFADSGSLPVDSYTLRIDGSVTAVQATSGGVESVLEYQGLNFLVAPEPSGMLLMMVASSLLVARFAAGRARDALYA